MAKIKKMADGGSSSLGDIVGSGTTPALKTSPLQTSGGGFGGGGGGGGAQAGLNQVQQGAGRIGSALGQASSALSQASSAIGDGGGLGDIPKPPLPYPMKKGGSVTSKKYADKSGRLNLGSGRVSTAQNNSKHSKW